MTIQKTFFSAFFLLLSLIIYANKKPQPIKLGESVSIKSSILNENRTINIYLPPEYSAKSDKKYPVVYILDGGVEEDFIHLTGIFRFNALTWINRFPEAIIIGIENTNRRRDFTFPVNNLDFIEKEGFSKTHFPQYGGADNYIKFLQQELIPYVEKKYNVNSNRTVVGESLAGLMSAYLLVNYPTLFCNYIIVSPSLWWGDGQLLQKDAEAKINEIQQPINVFVAAPKKEEDVKMYNESVQFYSSLLNNASLNTTFDYLEDETHATVFHLAVYNALKKQFQIKK